MAWYDYINPYKLGQKFATWTGAGTNNEWDIADESESQLKGLRMRDMHNIPAARNFYQQNLGTQGFPHSRYNYRSVDPSNPDFSGIMTTPQAQDKTNLLERILNNTIIGRIGEKFKRSPEKQAEIDAFNQTGMFGNLQGKMWDDASSGLGKISLRDPVTGAILVRDKNVDSMFGSDTIEEMAAKKDAWIKNRILKNKPISKVLQAYAKNQGFYDPPGNVTTGDGYRDTSGWGRVDQGYTTRGGFTHKADPTSGQVRGHHGGGNWGNAPGTPGGWGPGKNKKDGGRIGYRFGEAVEQETDFIQGPQGAEEFQETVVEGQPQPSREQLEALARHIFQLPLDDLNDQQLVVVYQAAMQGEPMEEAVQEEDVQFAANGGLASLL